MTAELPDALTFLSAAGKLYAALQASDATPQELAEGDAAVAALLERAVLSGIPFEVAIRVLGIAR